MNPLPEAPTRMRPRTMIAFALVGVAAFVPFRLPALAIGYVTTAIVYAVAILGINLIAGFVGRVALGHGAFIGLGAYAAVILNADYGWPMLATIPFAGAMGFAVGVIIGVPSLRIRGLHLALVTLAVGAAFGPIVKRLETITNGANGKGSTASWVAPTWLGEGRDANARWWYAITLLAGIAVFVLVWNLTRSHIGRALVAIRDNEVAARTNGVPVQRYILAAFGFSAAVASVAGALLMLKEPFA